MSERITPKRFGLKYSPKPTIAMEYKYENANDSGTGVLEVVIERLSPRTHDVKGVVDDLQKRHPGHLGAHMVSASQLQRLVSRLLQEGKDYLPEEYLSQTGDVTTDTTQKQISSSSPCPTKPSTLPDPDKTSRSDLSGANSRDPTPAPTPEAHRATRDLSDASDEKTCGPGNFSGDEGKTGVPAIAHAGQASNRDDGQVERQIVTGSRASTPPAASKGGMADVKVRVQEEEEGDKGAESSSRRDEDRRRTGEEGEDNENPPANNSPHDKTQEQEQDKKEGNEYDEREGERNNGASSSLSRSSSGPEARPETLKLHLTPENGRELVRDGGVPEGESNKHDRRRNDEELMPERLLSSSPSDVLAAVSTAAVEEQPGRESRPGQSPLGESGSGKGEGLVKEDVAEEEDFPEIEEEDDPVPEDIESEDFDDDTDDEGRTKSSIQAAQREDGQGHSNDSGEETRSDEGDRNGRLDDTDTADDLHADDTLASAGDAESTADSIGVVRNRNGHRSEDVSAPRPTAKEASSLDSLTSLAASLPSPPPPPTLPIAPIVPPASGEEDSAPSLSSNPSPPLSPGGRTSPSSPASLPLPPMGGARPRLGLLGDLPPVGGRGLPSLAPPVGKRPYNAREGEDTAKRESTGGTDDEDDDYAVGVRKSTDTPVSASPAPSLSSGSLFGLSAARSSTTLREPVAVAPTASESLRPSRTRTTREDHTNSSNDDIGAVDETGVDKISRFSMIPGVEDQNKEEEADFRARLGLGEDGESEDAEQDSGDDTDEGGRRNSTSSTPGSPKQHQGQEEENAGRTLPAKGQDVPSPAKGGGSDYFGDSDEGDVVEDDEISSVEEDMSFEQESAGSGDGLGSDDYFS